MVGYPLRFIPSFINLKKEINDGTLGEVQIAISNLIGPGPLSHRLENGNPAPVPSWWFKGELSGGGALMDLGCHLINLLRWYFGEITDIRAYLGYRFNLDFEDYATCFVKFNKLVSIINLGWFSSSEELSIQLFGTVGHKSVYPDKFSSSVPFIYQLMAKSAKLWDPYF